MPTLNLGFDYALTEKWILGVHAGYLGVDADWGNTEIDGKFFRGDAGVRWQVVDNIVLRASYLLFDVDADYEDDDIHLGLDTDFSGPLVSMNAYF